MAPFRVVVRVRFRGGSAVSRRQELHAERWIEHSVELRAEQDRRSIALPGVRLADCAVCAANKDLAVCKIEERGSLDRCHADSLPRRAHLANSDYRNSHGVLKGRVTRDTNKSGQSPQIVRARSAGRSGTLRTELALARSGPGPPVMGNRGHFNTPLTYR
jgi:hypothetical protein